MKDITAVISIAQAKPAGDITSWIVTFCASGFFFYQFILINIFNAFNEPMLREFHLSAAQIGHVSASYFFAGMLSLILAGIILDRYSVRKVIITAFSVTILSTAFFSIAPTPFYAGLARFIAGISGTYCFLGPMKVASRWFPPQRLALIIGLIVSYAMIGGIIAQTPITLLADAVGWRQASMLVAVGGLFFLLLIVWKVQDYPGQIEAKIAHQSVREFFAQLKQTIMTKQNWIGGLFISLINLPVYILGAMWGGTYLVQVHGLTRTESTYVTSMIFVGMIFGSPVMGWISDKMRLRKKPMIIFGVLAITPFIFLLELPHPSLTTLMLLFLAIGFLIGVQVIGYPLVAESNPKEHYATAQGLVSTVVIMGGLTQPIFGRILSFNWNHQLQDNLPLYSVGSFNLAMLMMPVAILLAVIIAYFAKETYCKH